jgi:glutathione synthetase
MFDRYRLVEVDSFIANLWKIHEAVKVEGYKQSLTLGMFRSDYMLHSPDDSSTFSLKQVEFNTISSSFGGLAKQVAALHTELATFPSPKSSLAYPPHPLLSKNDKSIKSDIVPPPNESVETLCSGLVAAHNAYGPSRSSPALPLCILFLVQDHERNIFDQLALSTYLSTHHHIPSFRLPTSSILTQTTIPTENLSRPLHYTSPANPTLTFEATVVYFRALYAPTEYTSPTSWSARHHLERSAAIKCPSVLLQLAGSKKVQQVLTSKPPGPDNLARFLPNHSKATHDSLRETFSPQYSMSASDDPSQEGPKLALDEKTAEKHVLKPQREGGGNNIYRSNIPTFLKSIPEKDYKQYILMELIQPPADAKNTVLRSDGKVVSGDVISELGIFGTCLWDTKPDGKIEVLHNDEGGYLLRTKGRDSDEGGVAAGFSSLDSLVLYEEEA